MKPIYKYQVFGLNIRSELELPELIPADFDQSDANITLDNIPGELPDYTSKGVLYQAKPGAFLFQLDTVGRYLVENGKSIRVERLNHAGNDELRLFLLGSAFGAMLHQRGLLPFHGSTVVKDGKALIIGGISGVGKSTLAAVFVRRGYNLLADDISVIDFREDKAMAFPGIPHLKLWQDVLGKMGETTGYEKVRPQLMKYRKPITEKLEKKPMEIQRILVLGTKNTMGFESHVLKGLEKFNALKNNTYRFRFVEGLGTMQSHFALISKLAGIVNVIQVKRPNSPLLLEELADFVEDME